MGVSWEEAAADAVLAAAGGSPYLIQRLGDEAWARVAPAAGDVITHAAADAAIVDTRESLSAGMFRGRWTKATPAEQALKAAIAHVAGDDGVATTADITAVLQRTTPQLSTPRKGLLDKGLVESAGTGKLRFTMPGFDEYVRDQTDLPSAARDPLPPGVPRDLPPGRRL